MVTIEHATPADVPALTAVQTRTFDDDSQRFLGQPSGGPPGYDSEQWQHTIMLEAAAYYKFCENDQIVGGMIIFRPRRGEYVLGRIYVDPAYQDRGIGTQAMQFMEQAFPDARVWRLDTPPWATRNHHFYEKIGYVRIPSPPGDDAVWYEKQR